ncbi:hypothetical protein J3F83DRAFT_301119 [Trichoderma novae-zelandiae]
MIRRLRCSGHTGFGVSSSHRGLSLCLPVSTTGKRCKGDTDSSKSRYKWRQIIPRAIVRRSSHFRGLPLSQASTGVLLAFAGKGGGKATAQGASLSLAQIAAFSPMDLAFQVSSAQHTLRVAAQQRPTVCTRRKHRQQTQTDRRTDRQTGGQDRTSRRHVRRHNVAWHDASCVCMILPLGSHGIQKRNKARPRDPLSRLIHKIAAAPSRVWLMR